jgi:hypothetical protein
MEHAQRLVSSIAANQPDVLALNELWDDEIRASVVKLQVHFPHWIAPLVFQDVEALTNSGLFIMSKFPFLQLGAPAPGYQESARIVTNTTPCLFGIAHPLCGVIGSDIFDGRGFSACNKADCFASKGVGVVRVDIPGTSGDLNIAFTHMQADYPTASYSDTSTTRARQFQVIGEALNHRLTPAMKAYPNDTFLMGDLNVPGISQSGAEYLGKVYTATLGDRRYSDVWSTTSVSDRGLTQRGDVERLDYIMRGGRTSLMPADSPPERCVQWVRNAYADGPSDHIGILMDLGPTSAACNPKSAINLLSIGTANVAKVTGNLPAPGAVMWYRIDDPSTLSVGFLAGSDAEANLRMDMFAEDDLSKPIAPVNSDTRIIAETCVGGSISCDFRTKTYFPPNKPAYLRVYHPQGLRSGDFYLYLRRHDCSSPQFACGLRASAPFQNVGTGTAFTGSYTSHYFFSTDKPSRDAQAMTVVVGNPSSIPLVINLARNGAAAPTRNINSGLSIPLTEALSAQYTLSVRRPIGSAKVSVGWQTNLYYVVGDNNGAATIKCMKETSGLGDDEIRVFSYSPYASNVSGAVAGFWPGFGQSDVQPLRLTGNYTVPVTLQVDELDSESVGGSIDGTDTALGELQSLPPNEFERRNLIKDYYFNGNPNQGHYQVRYSLVHSLR